MLMEEYRMRVFENRVLRGIFGPQREEGHVARIGEFSWKT
jgi:hypothetical protein